MEIIQRFLHFLSQKIVFVYNWIVYLLTKLVFGGMKLYSLLTNKDISKYNLLVRKTVNILIAVIWIFILCFIICYHDIICEILYIIPDYCPNSIYCLFPYISKHIIERIICSIGFLIFGWTLILFSYGFFRKHLMCLFFMFWGISIWGIFLYANYDSSQALQKKYVLPLIIESGNDINNALSSFFPSRGDTDVATIQKHYKVDEKQNLNVGCYILFHCIAYLFCGIMTTSLWGRRFINHLHNIATLDENKYVFWGQELDERCLILGQDIYNNHLHSEIVVSLFDNHVANYIDENRLYDNFYQNHFILRIYNENYFPFSNLYAPNHFFISDDETWNLKGCIKLLEERKKFSIKNKVDIFIRLGEGEKCDLYKKILDSIQIATSQEEEKKNTIQTQSTESIPSDLHIVSTQTSTILTEQTVLPQQTIQITQAKQPVQKMLPEQLEQATQANQPTESDKPQRIFENTYIHVFNESELIARDFINHHPMLNAPPIKNNIIRGSLKLKNETTMNVLLLGFGWQGRNLLSNIVENSQFYTEDQKEFESPIFIDILDKNEKSFAQYKSLHREACLKYHLNFHVCDVISSQFLDWMSVKIQYYDRIIISLGEDSLNMEAYSLLQRLKKLDNCKEHLEIFVKQNHLPFEELKQYDCKLNDSGLKKNIFGLISTIYTSSIILDESIDNIAKYLHVFYKEREEEIKKENEKEIKKEIEKEKTLGKIEDSQKKSDDYKKGFINRINDILNEEVDAYKNISDEEVDKKWNEASPYDKQSSCAQAEGVKNLLYLFGYQIKNNDSENNEEVAQRYNNINKTNNDHSDKLLSDLKNKIIDNPQIKDFLAEIEHMRWEAYMLMKGVKPWYVDQHTTYQEAKINNFKASQVDAKNRHAALIEFKRLPYVDTILRHLKLMKDSNDSCQSKTIDLSDWTTSTPIPSALQKYDYNVNLLPLILKKAKVEITRINS